MSLDLFQSTIDRTTAMHGLIRLLTQNNINQQNEKITYVY